MDTIKVGVIGLGCRSVSNMERMLMIPDVEIVAVCDIYEDRCDAASEIVTKNGKKAPFKTTDYKEVIKAIKKLNLEPTIICESAGTQSLDSKEMKDYADSLN